MCYRSASGLEVRLAARQLPSSNHNLRAKIPLALARNRCQILNAARSLTAPAVDRRATERTKIRSIILSPLYRFYEHRLTAAVFARSLPGHVGIILDGHRRYGRKFGISDPRALYDIGARKLDEVLDWCAEIEIAAVTLWVFSPENLRRSSREVSAILAAIEAKLRALARDAHIHNRRIRVRAIGKLSLVPQSVQVAIRLAEAATAAYDGMLLNNRGRVRRSPRDHRCSHRFVER